MSFSKIKDIASDDMERDETNNKSEFEELEKGHNMTSCCSWRYSSSFYFCFGSSSYCVAHPQPFQVRLKDYSSLYLSYQNGMYKKSTEKFNRQTYSKYNINKHAGYDKETGIESMDMLISSKTDKNVSVPIRIFYPKSDDGHVPVFVYIHGGGFCLGSSSNIEYHKIGTIFATHGFLVVSIDYRLAPENQFPAAIYDCFEVIRWISTRPEELKPAYFDQGIILSGDSAGGNLACILSTLIQNGLGPDLKPSLQNISISKQILFYPILFTDKFLVNLKLNKKHSVFLSHPILNWFVHSYLGGDDDKIEEFIKNERRINPLLSDVSKLPLTYLVTAGGDDILLKEQKYFLEKLQKHTCHSDAIHRHYENLFHGFLSCIEILPEANEVLEILFKDLKRIVERKLVIGMIVRMKTNQGMIGKIECIHRNGIVTVNLGWGKAYCPYFNLIPL